VDALHRFSVSGDVRLAELLMDSGVTEHVYDDGGRAKYDPVLFGIKADESRVYPDQVDSDATTTEKAGSRYTSRSFMVPPDAAVIAANRGATISRCRRRTGRS